MPSDKNPALIVNPGPGRLSAGVATDSAFIFNGSGGGGAAAALHAHIVDPVDAHMASAIGVNAIDPVTGQPILYTAGGVVDGESVLDFIMAAKDLWPVPPDRIGWDVFTVPNSGRPMWGTLDEVGSGVGEAVTGAFPRGTDVVFTNHIIASTTMNPAIYGMIYPADRGVLALYHSPNGDFFDVGTTLLSAIWLGSAAAPAGIPSANFEETFRHTQQGDHFPIGGLDNIYLTNRVPYLRDYSPYLVLWTDFDADFLRYQIASYVQTPDLAVPNGDAGSWLWVHWREDYATSLAAIQPSQLAANFNATNCYSTPQSPDFDTPPCYYVNRHNVYRDAASATVPTLSSSTTTTNLAAGPVYTFLSGVAHYTGFNLRFDFTSVQLAQMSNMSFYTGPSAPIPSEYPFSIDFSDFGGVVFDLQYTDVRKFGTGVNYSAVNSPQAADVWEYLQNNFSVWGYGPSAAPAGGYGYIRYRLRKPFHEVFVQDSSRYMYNSYPQTGGATLSTSTFEPFVDEKYRYVSTVDPTVTTKPLVPTGGDDFNSTIGFVGSDPNAQVIGGDLVYPQVNYGTGGFLPTGGQNYATVLAADPASHLRRYVRAFDTGGPRTTGKLRLSGLVFADFESSVPYTGAEAADHPGGAIIQVRIPGSTGWLDVGRVKGDPDLTLVDFRGCRIGMEVSGSDVIVTYDTTLPTVNNGSGAYPIFVRVTLIKGPGTALSLDELEWQAP